MSKKIKLTISETIEKEIEIKLPIYIRKGDHYYLVKGKEYGQTIVVYIEDPYEISSSSYKLAFNTDYGWKEISKEEFEKAFDKVIKGLTKKIK